MRQFRDLGSATHVGWRRIGNEDEHHAQGQLLVVADGMGGHAAGEIAAAIAVTTITQARPSSADELVGAVHAAHLAVLEGQRTNPGWREMGCTVVAAGAFSDGVWIAWVGDSRAYGINADRHGQLLTVDDTIPGRMVADGTITAAQARCRADGHLLLACIGAPENPEVHVEPVADDIVRLVLCSGGLSDPVQDKILIDVARTLDTPPADVANRLIGCALGLGGPDNVTAVVGDLAEIES